MLKTLSKSVFLVDKTEIPYSIKRTKRRRRTLTLALHPYQGLIISAPWRTQDKEIHSFLLNNQEWIASRMEGFEPLKTYNLEHTEDLFFAGLPCSLELGKAKRSSVIYDNHTLCILTKPHKTPDEHKKNVYQQLKKYCSRVGHPFLQERLSHWEEKIGVNYHSLKITDPKHRWGSCDTKNIIRLNWRIMLTPLDLIDYLMVHELCHVRHKNHSKDYWDLVGSVMPDHRERRKQLHRHPAGFLRV
jgi:predicted metal-dependent hydrolase